MERGGSKLPHFGGGVPNLPVKQKKELENTCCKQIQIRYMECSIFFFRSSQIITWAHAFTAAFHFLLHLKNKKCPKASTDWLVFLQLQPTTPLSIYSLLVVSMKNGISCVGLPISEILRKIQEQFCQRQFIAATLYFWLVASPVGQP